MLALSKGTFDEVVELRRGIVLWGACVAETIVTSTVASETEAVITVRYPNTEVRNLQISGQRWGVGVFGEFAQLNIQDVLIDDSYVAGIYTEQGKLSAHTLIVRDTHARPSDGRLGSGLQVAYGAEGEVTQSLF